MITLPSRMEVVSCPAAGATGAVVIGRNEGERLLKCIESLRDDVPTIIYVDSASSDGSVELARSLGATVVELSEDRQLTAARGRHTGLQRLLDDFPNCEFVQFVDGDCIVQKGWLSTAASFLAEHPGCAAVCGRRFEASPRSSLYNQMIDREWSTPIGEAEACGGDSLMRVAALRQAGSFRPDLLAGEEPELCTRLRSAGWTVWRIDAPMTEHDARISRLSHWLRRARRGGAGYAQVWSITRNIRRPLYGRQITSALFWALGIPASSVAVALGTGRVAALAIFPLLWSAQVLRIAVRTRPGDGLGFRLKAGALIMLTKFAEASGILSFWLGFKKPDTSYRSLGGEAAMAKEGAA